MRDGDAPLAVLYDHDCNFCVVWIAALIRLDHYERLQLIPIQSTEGERRLSDVTPDERLASWHAVATDGQRWSGGDAFAPILAQLPRGARLAALAARAGAPADWAYRIVAQNRTRLSRFVPPGVKLRARRIVAARRERAADAEGIDGADRCGVRK